MNDATAPVEPEVVVMPPLARHLPIEMGNEMAERIGQLGRTEDIRFSPDGTRLAIAGFRKNTCLILTVDIAEGPVVRLTSALEVTSDHLRNPHGFDFIGNDRLVVANRDGGVVIFRLPDTRTGTHALRPIRLLTKVGRGQKIHSPGSVATLTEPDGSTSLLVCQNYAHVVSHHHLPKSAWRRVRARIVFQYGLDIPDGIAISPDQNIVAISSHSNHRVFLFAWNNDANPQSRAVGWLDGVQYPHGLRFTPDGETVFVADAGQPSILVFRRPSAGWSGRITPSFAFAPISESVFRAGRYNPQEGGPKGIDIDPTGRVLVVTNEEQPLAFFAIASLLESAR